MAALLEIGAKDLLVLQLMPVPPHHVFVSVQFRMVCSFASLPIFSGKRPLNQFQ